MNGTWSSGGYGGASAYGGYDPYTGAAYPAYNDPYGYGAYGGDPYYGGYGAYGPQYGGQQQQGVPTLFDPLAPLDVDKLNSAYMSRRLSSLTGAYARPIKT